MEARSNSKVICFSIIVAAFVLGICTNQASANIIWDTYLNGYVQGSGYLPLGSDPGNVLFPDSVDGYAPVLVDVKVSIGGPGQDIAFAIADGPMKNPGADPLFPPEYDGMEFANDSRFSLFFEKVEVTDIDDRLGRDLFGQPDGGMIELDGFAAPIDIYAFHEALFDSENPDGRYGLKVLPVTIYLGWSDDVEALLGGDVNENGEDDIIRFEGVALSIGEDSAEAEFHGYVCDESNDPPFTIGGLTGPTTVSSNLQNPVIQSVIPAPGALVLGSIGIGLVGWLRRRRTI